MPNISASIDEELKDEFAQLVEDADMSQSKIMVSLVKAWIQQMKENDKHHTKIKEHFLDTDIE